LPLLLASLIEFRNTTHGNRVYELNLGEVPNSRLSR
jgi:hypothetical protein